MIKLQECKTPEDRETFKNVVNNHHSYIKHKMTPTRRVDFLVYEQESKNLIGAIGLNSATLNLGARDKALGLNNQNKKKKLLNIANNYRFALIKENITIQNAGSQILKALRHDGAKVWKRKYGNKLVGIETFVKPPWTGSVYKADNWLDLGLTKGWTGSRLPLKLIPEHLHEKYIEKFKKDSGSDRSVHFEKTEPKLIFFKALDDRTKEKFKI